MFQRVAEFHRAFGLPIATTPELPAQAVRDLRVSLLEEELNEFCAAYSAHDRIEEADALADICYIVAGTVVSYGIGPAAISVFESPYDEHLPRTKQPRSDLDGLLRDTFNDYLAAERTDDLKQIDLSLMDLLVSVFGVAWQLNIPLNAVFTEVHRSNMTKLMPDGSVLRRDDGKVLKPPHWSPPDIAGVLGSRE